MSLGIDNPAGSNTGGVVLRKLSNAQRKTLDRFTDEAPDAKVIGWSERYKGPILIFTPSGPQFILTPDGGLFRL